MPVCLLIFLLMRRHKNLIKFYSYLDIDLTMQVKNFYLNSLSRYSIVQLRGVYYKQSRTYKTEVTIDWLLKYYCISV